MRSSVRFPALAVTALALAGLACSGLAPTAAPQPTAVPVVITQLVPAPQLGTDGSAAPQTNLTITSSEEDALIDLYARVNPAVVSFLVETADGGGQGSGFLYDLDGHIVTNQHVVDGATSIEVDFPSGLKTRGRVLGTDPDSDLAVVKVDEIPPDVTPLVLADSDQGRVGQRAIAIGNPFGEAGTMTLGIISGTGRTLSSNRTAPGGGGRFTAPDVLQTDAPINPGNSGGPLLNLSGEVIGINRAIATETGIGAGVGYAVAANTVRQVVPYLISEGQFIYPYLGISSLPALSSSLQEQLDLPQASGTYVTTVTAGGPADQAGLQPDSASDSFSGFNGDGDLIVAVDGREVRVLGDLMSYLINNKRPGDAVTLTVIRGGERQDVQVILGERP